MQTPLVSDLTSILIKKKGDQETCEGHVGQWDHLSKRQVRTATTELLIKWNNMEENKASWEEIKDFISQFRTLADKVLEERGFVMCLTHRDINIHH